MSIAATFPPMASEKLTADEKAASVRLKQIWNNNKKRLGLTQTNMAERFRNRDGESITQGGVGHYLNGRSALNARACVMFAEALQVSPDDFAPVSALKELDILRNKRRQDGYVEISYYRRKFSAGAGANNEDDASEDRIMFQKSWLDSEGLNSQNLTAIDVAGDSMAPQIVDGDTVLVRRDKTTIEDGKIYAFDHGQDQRIKRVFRKSKGLIVMVSDNPVQGGSPEIIRTGDLNDVMIIGQVWHRSGRVV